MINIIIKSFLQFHNEIKEECKQHKLQFVNWYILKPVAFTLALIIIITL